MRPFKHLISIIFVIFLTHTFCLTSYGEERGPGKIIVETIDEGLKILKDPALQGNDKFGERRRLLWNKINPVFDFEETSKRTLGYHWRNRTPEEQKEFTQLFVDILKNIYLDKSDSYAGEKILYVREIIKGNRGKVRTNFITADQKQIVVDFSMHKVENLWSIYDVTIEGVSIVSNYRSQFRDILSESSFEELMEKLKEKNSEIGG